MRTRTENAFTLSLIISILFNTLFAIIKELVSPVKLFMKTYLFHHWLAHGFIVLLFFMLLGIILSKTNVRLDPAKVPFYIIISIIIASIGISGFYISHVH